MHWKTTVFDPLTLVITLEFTARGMREHSKLAVFYEPTVARVGVIA